MAQKIVLIDDIDGTEAEETVTFTLDGKTTTIDLSKKNASALRDALSQYVAAGRTEEDVQVFSRARPRARGAKTDPAQLNAIRTWANSHGFKVSNRGRIPANVTAAYEAAH